MLSGEGWGCSVPIYEYKCQHCAKVYEKLRNMTQQNDPTTCPTCGSKDTHKIISAANFVLKGAGFYANDYKKKGS